MPSCNDRKPQIDGRKNTDKKCHKYDSAFNELFSQVGQVLDKRWIIFHLLNVALGCLKRAFLLSDRLPIKLFHRFHLEKLFLWHLVERASYFAIMISVWIHSITRLQN